MKARQNFDPVTGVILAGGFGTRLRSVSDRPKVLSLVQHRPFLAFLLDQLAAFGFRRVVLCTGYKGEEVRSAFGPVYGALRLEYSQESSPLDTGGALRLALPLLPTDAVLVMNGDSFCQVNLRAFLSFYQNRSFNAALLLTQVTDTSRYGRVEVDQDGRVLHFGEKEANGHPGWINAGIYLLKRRLLQEIEANRAVSLEREILPHWIGRGLYGYCSQGNFLDIGTPESYTMAEQFFSRGKFI